jgi:hypothetical protein
VCMTAPTKKIFLLVMLLFTAGSFSVLLSRTAQASGPADAFGTTVLDCFHPEAKFSSVSFTRGARRHPWIGLIKFREGRADAEMTFAMDTKTTQGGDFYRITPLTDGGPSVAASGCYLRDWQPY